MQQVMPCLHTLTMALATLSWLSPLAARVSMSEAATLSTDPRRCFIAFFSSRTASGGISAPSSMAWKEKHLQHTTCKYRVTWVGLS